MKREHPLWGPKKVIGRLRLIEPEESWPSPSTAGVILDRAGLVKRRRRRRRSTPWGEPFSGAKRPNDVWSIDFKGWFRTADGTRIDPLTVQDAASRYLLVCDGLERPNGPEARRVLEDGQQPCSMQAVSATFFGGCTGRSRPRRPRLRRPTAGGSIMPLTASGKATTARGRTRHSDRCLRPCTRRRRGPTLRVSVRRSTKPRSSCAGSASTDRSSGREAWCT